MDIEVCIEKIQTAIIANKYGATRVELCDALDIGGTTPSIGSIESCVDNCDLQVFVMIRPRGGNFVYDDLEISIMKNDIKAAANAGVYGVVFGCLTDNFEIDIKNNKELLALAKSYNLNVTFHRAFDIAKNINYALEQIIDMGFDRILTSGGKPTAIEGLDIIKKLASSANHTIEIMAGSGINAGNCTKFFNAGINAIHFTARKVLRKNNLNMGFDYTTDVDKIKDITTLSLSRYRSQIGLQ